MLCLWSTARNFGFTGDSQQVKLNVVSIKGSLAVHPEGTGKTLRADCVKVVSKS